MSVYNSLRQFNWSLSFRYLLTEINLVAQTYNQFILILLKVNILLRFDSHTVNDHWSRALRHHIEKKRNTHYFTTDMWFNMVVTRAVNAKNTTLLQIVRQSSVDVISGLDCSSHYVNVLWQKILWSSTQCLVSVSLSNMFNLDSSVLNLNELKLQIDWSYSQLSSVALDFVVKVLINEIIKRQR